MEEQISTPRKEHFADEAVNQNDVYVAGLAEARTTSGKPVRRDISPLSMVALGFNICNSWTAIATAFAIAISAAGTFNLIYGILIVTVAYAGVALTLAELASVYPTAGGQYHFTSILAPERSSRALSYICGITATYSWVFMSAAITLFAAEVLIAFPQFYIESYVSKAWHTFLVYQALNFVVLLYNLLALKRATWTHEIGFFLTLLTFITVSITCLARSTKASSSFVWDNFENNTGWDGGVAFLTGLVTPASMFLGLDGALHLADECLQPERTVPKALITTTVIGFVTGFVFAIAMCYGITDFDVLINDSLPIYPLWRQAIKNDTAATIFLVATLGVLLFAINAIQQTASRMTWALANDKGIVFSKYLSRIHPTLEVPVWALLANAFVVLVVGCIYLGSVIAFNAIIGTSIILQVFSFAMPAALLLFRRRSSAVLPPQRAFKLPTWLGYTVNILTVVTAIVEIIFYDFPPALPVTGSSMNYAVAVLGGTAILAGVNWLIYAGKHYAGPRIVFDS
ncbi:hypothetical protein A1O1_06682 [Capronia coronata CBS 617.96]|uniref:Choline transport protein n=1 Tax=Capronia coronata CBS 617.96 TaxID=1182541 RepID=W9YLB2_9EURO|nr:uncharacterized protein A1O1_06682 [Capronia coronata CBS 617.96]EXJ83064.1 hypothetical protein A1O1_06682 [Capronia coronata CBS 617.96]